MNIHVANINVMHMNIHAKNVNDIWRTKDNN
jgi:hypothetical protein